MSNAVHLLATLHAHPGHGPTLEAALRQLVPASRAEAGCLQYELHQDRDTPERFYMLEIWRSAAALEHHRQTEHFCALVASTATCWPISNSPTTPHLPDYHGVFA